MIHNCPARRHIIRAQPKGKIHTRKGFFMKTFRFLYWFNSCETECYVKAENEQEALEKFRERKGDRRIVSIERCRFAPN